MRGQRGYQTGSEDPEGAGATPTVGGGAAAQGCTAGRGCSMGRVVATVGDALEPTTRAGRIAGSMAGEPDWATADSDRPAARAAGETPQGGVAGDRVCRGEVDVAADRGVDPARVWGAPGGKFGVADAAADGLECAAPGEPSPAAEFGSGDAVEADAMAFPDKSVARQARVIVLRPHRLR